MTWRKVHANVIVAQETSPILAFVFCATQHVRAVAPQPDAPERR